MKVKRKGQVYPSLPSPSNSSYKDPDCVLKLLPVTILALAISLPEQDREVLAYLIARSIAITTTTNPSSLITQHPTNKCKTNAAASKKNGNCCDKKIPHFQCGCFDCYTGFWYRWDSSPNRDSIHQVIEAFEEHLVQNIESPKKHSKGKKKGKVLMMGHLESDYLFTIPAEISVPEPECEKLMVMEENLVSVDIEEHEADCEEETVGLGEVNVQASGYNDNHKAGLARKVLPDVVGLLNSRLWSTLWSPGV